MLAGERPSVGAGRLADRPRRGRQRVGGDRGLTRADVALQEPEHRRGPREVLADRAHRDRLVDRQVDRLPDAPTERVDEGGPDRAVGGLVERHFWRRVAYALAAPGDHPELEREELVERQPTERRVAPLERVGIVGLLDRPDDRHEPFLGDDRRGQVLRVRVAGLVERLADRRPEADRGQPGGQRVDRHDPAGVEQLRVVGDDLELRVVEGQPAAEVLDLAGDDDLAADHQPSLDEPPPEPRRARCCRCRLEPRDRALRPAAEARLHADVADAGLAETTVPSASQTRSPSTRISRRSSYRRGRWNSRSRTV